MAYNPNDYMRNSQGIALAERMKTELDTKADAESVYTKTEVDSKLSSAYKASGSVTFAGLPAADKAHLGYVYNVTEAFTTTASFVEGENAKYPAGTNVVIVEIPPAVEGEDPTYKYDVLAGFVDTSNFVEKETGKGLSTNDFTDDLKNKLDGISVGNDEDWNGELDRIFGSN